MTKRPVMPVKKTGRVLGVGRSKVFDLLRHGEIKRVKIGRRTLILTSSVSEYLERLQSNR